MKRVEIERQAIVRALDRAPNITEAARNLGAARRTLQSRMRDYDIPPGDPGRPREHLPYTRDASGFMPALAAVAVVGLCVIVYREWKKTAVVVGGVRMTGLDLLGATRTR